MYWFSYSGGESQHTLEHMMYDLEETVLGEWRKDFIETDRMKQNVDQFTIETFSDVRGLAWIKSCEEKARLVDMYNKFFYELYKREPKYMEEKNKWLSYKSSIEGVFKAFKEKMERDFKTAKDQMEAQEKQRKEEEDKIREEEEREKADPFSDLNLNKEDDPFGDINIETVNLDF
eukprot:TRINITY_DN2890_c0_g2_i1.p1 TRINITY_DN2890_c0_g2~~TRINITY_DN2890_c0_g2_i1.p1  ORF type:complete len:175 (-),score=47.54 TRINITY_DN2890_c0_g2_i1:46-570(-)